MSRKFFLAVAVFMILALATAGADKRFTLVIDAGHGGGDVGAIGAISKEKDINLNVALAFGRYVENNCPDVRVIYTRKTDVFVPLHERANIANRNKADLFISVHTNSLPNKKVAHGVETYTLGMHRASDNLDVAKRENAVILIEKDYKQHYEGFDPNSAESYIMFEFLQDRNMSKSVDLARCVQNRVCATANRQNRGVRQAGFLVLRETSMPSCLIELGFITAADEEQYLNSSKGIDALANGIYKAFVDYKGKYDKTITVPYHAETKQTVNIPTIVPAEEMAQKKTTQRKKKKYNGVLEDMANKRMMDSNGNECQEAKTDTVAKAKPATDEKKAVETETAADTTASSAPVFKVQITTCNRNLRPGSQQLKGLTDVDCYQENGLYKYTCGASTDYNEIYRLRKTLLDKFPEAFIIAFKDGARTDVVKALNEFKRNKNKK